MRDGTPVTVLVVEDDRRSRELITEILRNDGYVVVDAPDGERGLKELLRGSVTFDLVVLDMMMPGLDGFAVAREIRRDARFDTIPILAVTAMSQPEQFVRALEAGCDSYLAKPISIGEVREIVRGLLTEVAEDERVG